MKYKKGVKKYIRIQTHTKSGEKEKKSWKNLIRRKCLIDKHERKKANIELEIWINS